ncbi:MAG: NAD(P)/FAD-dependent oxidoreductase [Alphaproteobacteria bacterium]
MSAPRVVVVGAGPAGARAAETLARHGLFPVVIDEAPQSGGQIYRRPPAGFRRPAAALYGFEAAKARRLHAAFDALADAIDYRPETLVWNLSRGVAHTLRDGQTDELAFDALILATGAMDRIVPFPGWTTPGVFTLGGAQVALKHQGCAVGRRVAFAGAGPLLYLVAYQYLKAGAALAAVIDSAPLSAKVRALPGLCTGGATFAKGLWYAGRLRARGVRIVSGAVPLAALGDSRVTGLRYRERRDRVGEVACDAVATGYGLKPESQLADLAGCRFAFDARAGQWLPESDRDGRSGVAGVYLAGDGARIAGADAAEARGELAALALLSDLGRAVPAARVAALRRRLRRLGRFRAALEAAFPHPRGLAAALPNETLLCRCEAITAGELRAAARLSGASEINRAKAASRVGMGRCQGRICGLAAAEVLAATCDAALESVGRLRGQAPVKPAPLPLEPTARAR